jgi:hypothetical protein
MQCRLTVAVKKKYLKYLINHVIKYQALFTIFMYALIYNIIFEGLDSAKSKLTKGKEKEAVNVAGDIEQKRITNR